MNSFRILALLFVLLTLSGCTKKKPHGRYVAKANMGSTFMEFSYDFQRNGLAHMWIVTDSVAVSAQGKWRMVGDAVRFDGVWTEPKSKEKKKISHTLHFDGDDLFKDGLIIRFVKQK